MPTLDDIQKDVSQEFAFLGIDMARHSTLVTKYRESFEPVRQQFRKYAEGEIEALGGCLHSWEGDGGIAVFWGDDFVERAVMCAMSVVMQMYLFNLRHSTLPEFADAKAAVHRGNAIPRKDPSNWFGEGLNFAGKLFKAAMDPGRVIVSHPAYSSLSDRLRARFHRIGDLQGTPVYAFGREMMDPAFEPPVRYIESKRFLDIQGAEGNTEIRQDISFSNAHPSRQLEYLTWNLGHDENPMAWADCNLRAFDTRTGTGIDVQPIEVDDPYFKVWRFRFPPIAPGEIYSLTYSAHWNRMFPVDPPPSTWAAKIPSPITRMQIRIACPVGYMVRHEQIEFYRYVDPAEKERLTTGYNVVQPHLSTSGRWEVLLSVSEPRLYHTHELSWYMYPG